MPSLTTLIDIFKNFLLLGLISFGGPAAHVGYFYQTFVKKLNWLDDASYANLLSLSQLLPGPGSSQMGFAIGMHRGGVAGGFTAFFAFTLPSFFLMYLLAVVGLTYADNLWFQGVITGLKLLAVAVIAHATVSLGRRFCHTTLGVGLAVVTAVIMLIQASLLSQVLVLVLAAVVGRIGYQQLLTPEAVNADKDAGNIRLSRRAIIVLGLFFGLLAVLTLVSTRHSAVALFGQFYQAGSLVFGGGHVVLPLLEQIIGHQMSNDAFLLGYAGAQAVPGPMFSLGAYLGAVLSQDIAGMSAFTGALIATAGIFLPGFLLVIALVGVWQRVATRPKVAGAIAGINAAVVGLLITALYTPVFVSSVTSNLHLAAVIVGYFLLSKLNVPIGWLVIGFAMFGVAIRFL